MKDESEFIKNYDIKKYEQPSVAADIAVFTVKNIPENNYRKLDKKSLQLLMVKRGKPPFEDFYALPGGFAMKTETVDNTAKRELHEETGVDGIYMEQLKTTSTPGRDPRGWIISCAYLALVDSSRLEVCGGDDASEARWFDISMKKISENFTEASDKAIKTSVYDLTLTSDDKILTCRVSEIVCAALSGRKRSLTVISSEGIAFDHAEIIAEALLELRRKTAENGTAFNLLPEKFTMADLQKVYEAIMDCTETAANFRRKMSRFVIETNEMSQGAGHRPSMYYIRNMKAFC